MKNLYLARSMEELNKMADVNMADIKNASLDKLLKSAQKILEEGNRKFRERDEERAYVMYFKFVSLVLFVEKKAAAPSVNETVLKDVNSLKNLAGPALEKAEKLKKSLGKRYEEEATKNKIIQSSIAEKIENEDNDRKTANSAECEVKKKPISPTDLSSGRTMSCEELYNMMGDPSVKFLLIDVRPAVEFEKENITHHNSINIPAEILKPGITDSEIRLALKGAALSRWKEISGFDCILLMDYCTEDAKNLNYGHPLRVIEDVILSKYKGGNVKVPPRLVKGGYKEWLLSHSFDYLERTPNLVESLTVSEHESKDLHDKHHNTYPDLENLSIIDRFSDETSEISNNSQVDVNMMNESHHSDFVAPPVNRHTKPVQPNIDNLDFPKNVVPCSPLGKMSNAVGLEDFSSTKYIPEVDRSLKPSFHQNLNISNKTNNNISIALNKEDAVLKDILTVATEQLNKEKEFERLRLRKELEAEESKRIEIQKLEEELIENIDILSEKNKHLESQYTQLKEENKKMRKLLCDRGELQPHHFQDIEAKELQKLRMQEEVKRLRKIRKMKEQESIKGIQSPVIHEKDRGSISSKDHSKERDGQCPSEKEYTTSLRGFDATGGSSNLTRSYSSPNIAQMVADEIAEAKTSVHPTVDRSLKPKLARSLAMKNEIGSLRMRDLNPIYGNVTVRGATGLKNLGNTCYMNAIIQCLSNTEQIAVYFQSDSYRQHLRENNRQGTNGEVAEEFAVVIKALWAGQYRSFSAKDLKNVLSKYIPMCKGSEQQDSHEFLLVFMDKLHGDLNQGRDVAPLQSCNTLSDKEAANSFWNHHQTRNRSKISEIFEGLLKSSLSCCSCGHTSNSYEIFSCVSLPILSSKCSLQDCLTTFMKPERISGEAAWDCPSCKEKREAEKFSTFLRLPNVLIIQLKRFSYDGRWKSKLQVFVDFPHELEIICAGMKGKSYKLYGIVNHVGMLEGGHYTAYCKNYRNEKWYYYDDCSVTEISASSIKTNKAYLLFYTA